MKQFIIDNAQWIFSGAGVAILAGIIRLFWSRRMKHQSLKDSHVTTPHISADHITTQSISAGHASTNVQTGNGSQVFISTNHRKENGLTHTTIPIKIDDEDGIIYKVRLSEGDYQDFIWV